MLALRLLATYANLPVIGSSAISVLLPPALPSRLRGFLLQAKTPLCRTTCPSCNNRCADGGQTGLRVHLVFALRGGGCRPRRRSGRVRSRTGEAGGRRRNCP